jgi:hypothetical protein
MLDNLSWELLSADFGPPDPRSADSHPLPIALGTGLWKIASRELVPTSDVWRDAAAAVWNSGYFCQAEERRTASLGLYLLIAAGASYDPPRARAQAAGIDLHKLAHVRPAGRSCSCP